MNLRAQSFLLVIFIFMTFRNGLYAQGNVFSLPVTLSTTEVPLSFTSFIDKLEKERGIKFFFHPDWISYLSVNTAYTNMPLGTILGQILEGSELTYMAFEEYGIILMKDPARSIERDRLLTKAVAEQKKIQQVMLGSPGDYNPQKSVILRGNVVDEKNSSQVKQATISLLNGEAGAVTNDQGYYELILKPGDYLVSFRHANYAEKIIDLKIFTSGRLNVELEEMAILLEEVIVADQALVNKSIGQLNLKITDIKRSPTFLGETDVIKQVQSQAGVTTVGEVASGFNVRGGGVDQNLVLYDGVPVFNTAHAFGFFSAFNAEALNQVSFYKSGIPAEFGGRASSVLNVTSKEGNYNKWSGGGGIGLISTNLNVHGPIKKDTTTFIASYRTTYSNWMLNTVNSKYSSLENSSVAFYDGSLKLAHKFSDRSKITFSGYASQDQMRLTTDTLFQWNNVASSVRFDNTVNEELFYSITMGLGNYRYRMHEPEVSQAFDLTYEITYPTLKADFNYTRKRPVAFGLHALHYTLNPGTRLAGSESNIKSKSIRHEQALELAIYFSESFQWRERIFMDAGLRYPYYARLGPGTVYQYQPGASLESQNVTDSLHYPTGKVIKAYHGPEPRLAFRYALNTSSSVKVGYNRTYQFIHLISNTAAVTPVDVWQASNTFFRPQLADQLSAGYFKTLKENTIEIFAEVFYKHIDNILEFKDGANLILNDKLETALLTGISKSYGVELSAAKLIGRLQGSINYTWSRSFRQVNGVFSIEQINNGRWYPANFDQPHVINLMWRYGITRRHFFTGTFTYHSGRPISLPAQIYYIDGIGVSDFPERNTYRLPDYHRLDIAFVIEGNHKRKKLWDGTWIVSAYNFYGRRNAYSVFFQQDEFGILKPYQLSVIGTIIPTITYNFKF